MTDTLYWDVDTQHDFINENGKLPVPGAEGITQALADVTWYAQRSGDIRAGSVDAHTPNDPEFEDWGEHCVYGTPGQEKIPETVTGDELYVPNTELNADQQAAIAEYAADGCTPIFEKQQPSVADNPNVEPFLAVQDPDQIVLYGVVTEVCVDAAVDYLAEELGYDVAVIDDAIMHLDDAAAEECYDRWDDLGVERIGLDDLTPDAPDRLSGHAQEQIETAYLTGDEDDAWLEELVADGGITPGYALNLRRTRRDHDARRTR